MRLAQLLQGIAEVSVDTAISGLALDSRQVCGGDAFLACAGSQRHGLQFLPAALQRGAVAVLWEPAEGVAAPQLPPGVTGVAVPRLHALASELGARLQRHPSHNLRVVGITGTNGKTTTAWLLAQALSACGQPAAYLGTLGSAFGGSVQPGELTTPDPLALQRQLRAFADQGAVAVALEVSSHALAQSRVAAVNFETAVFTNLSRDHLDYHGTMQAYAAAKASLFAFANLRLRVINADDALGAQLLVRADAGQAVAFSRDPHFKPPADGHWLQAIDLRTDAGGTTFTLHSSYGTAPVHSTLLGGFNVENLLGVLGVLLGSGVPLAQAVGAVAGVNEPPGRLQRFGGAGLPLVVVDYAHTPDALDKALQVLRAHCTGKLWCVFGCGGDRDAGKRPQMGRIAAAAADRVILTDDNPRGESPAAIVAQIRAGMGAAAIATQVIPDRAEAIARAVCDSAADDAVLVAGKGHEDYQLVGSQRLAFSDAQCVQAALARRRAA